MFKMFLGCFCGGAGEVLSSRRIAFIQQNNGFLKNHMMRSWLDFERLGFSISSQCGILFDLLFAFSFRAFWNAFWKIKKMAGD